MLNPLEIKTFKSPTSDNQISFCEKRGGIITSLKLNNIELFYFDQETFEDTSVSVRGGVPILFPNAGAIESKEYPLLKQNGFARDSKEWEIKETKNGLEETLTANENTFKIYPYNFKLSINAKFENDESLTVIQTVENLEDGKEMPIAMGLHPYFKVPHENKKDIEFNFKGGEIIKEKIDSWSNGQVISIDNPNTVMEINIPLLGTVLINASSSYEKIWIWSLPEKDFICIEPMIGDIGDFINNPKTLKPKETFSAQVNFNLK